MAVRGSCAGLGHDELERDFGVAEVGRGAVPELVELQAGVVVQQNAAAVIAEAGPAGVRADVAGRWPAGRDGFAFGQEQRDRGPRYGLGLVGVFLAAFAVGGAEGRASVSWPGTR